MIQLNILSGKKAGAQSAARRFPFRIGRALETNCNSTTTAFGISISHWNLTGRKVSRSQPRKTALATINGGLVQTAILRNGDIITLGSAKLQFWLAAARQRGLRLREAFVWALLAAVTAAQFALIYWLIR